MYGRFNIAISSVNKIVTWCCIDFIIRLQVAVNTIWKLSCYFLKVSGYLSLSLGFCCVFDKFLLLLATRLWEHIALFYDKVMMLFLCVCLSTTLHEEIQYKCVVTHSFRKHKGSLHIAVLVVNISSILYKEAYSLYFAPYYRIIERSLSVVINKVNIGSVFN